MDGIVTEALTRQFPGGVGLTDLSIDVRPGEVLALLGPNGAGKTTTVRLLNGVLTPDSGQARVLGLDPVTDGRALRARTGVLTEHAGLDDRLTARENLRYAAMVRGLRGAQIEARIEQLLHRFGMTDRADRAVRGASTGQRKRLGLARSLLHDPDVLFLDEPTTGLDPRSRNQVWEIVRALVVGGTTVLLTTQYLDEADQLADRIAVIDQGKIIAEGTSGQLKASVGSGALHVRLSDPEHRPDAERILAQALGVPVVLGSDSAALSARTSDAERVAHALTELARSGIVVNNFEVGQPSLDEVFLTLTGRPAGPSNGTKPTNGSPE